MTALVPTLQAYFTERLMSQRHASSNTIAAYRDTFRLLLQFAADRTGTPFCRLDFKDLDTPLVGAFLTHLERDRRNSTRTRNNRLAAIHSLFSYAALHHPEHAASIQRVLAIPAKRFERNLVTFLTEPEADALLAACDRTTWTGRRDHTLLLLAVQTGLRNSELISLTLADITLGTGANVHTIGKGRKERRTPLLPLTVSVLKVWLADRGGLGTEPLFPTITGHILSRDALEHRLAVHVTTAQVSCASLRTKTITVHTLRHTAAMRLLESGVNITVIALWLGHEQVSTARTRRHDPEGTGYRTRHTPSHEGRPLPGPDSVLRCLDTL